MVANNPARKRAAIAAAAIVGSVLVVCVYFAWRSPPQMGPDEETFRGVDALLTALTARDERLLEQCARKLSLLKEAGKIPHEAAAYLDGIIAKARSGDIHPEPPTYNRRQGAAKLRLSVPAAHGER